MSTELLSSIAAGTPKSRLKFLEMTTHGDAAAIQKCVQLVLPALKLAASHSDAHAHVQTTVIETVINITHGGLKSSDCRLRLVGGGSLAVFQNTELIDALRLCRITLDFRGAVTPDSGGNGPASIEHAKDILRRLPNVQHLRLQKGLHSVVLPVLHETLMRDNSYRYPKLHTVELFGCRGYAPSDLLDYVKRRSMITTKCSKELGGDAKLRIIIRNGSPMDAGTVSKLESVVGAANVLWSEEE